LINKILTPYLPYKTHTFNNNAIKYAISFEFLRLGPFLVEKSKQITPTNESNNSNTITAKP